MQWLCCAVEGFLWFFGRLSHPHYFQRFPLSRMSGGCSTPVHPRKRAAIIIIGDEVLKGQVVDTNSHFICAQLYSMGVKVAKISVIPDNTEDIAHEVAHFSASHDLVCTTGGIGPTHDDMTYVGVAKAFQEGVQVHEGMERLIEKWLGGRGFKREVLLRMALLPLSAQLIFEPERPHSSFPIVAVRNVYVFPGVPHLVQKMFPRMRAVLGVEGAGFQFHTGVLYIAKDELSITHEIDAVVDKFKGITFGSYPVFDNPYYSTRITMESSSPEIVAQAKEYLVGLLPPNSLTNYDPQPLESAADKVYAIVGDPQHELHTAVREAVSTVEEALDKYSLDGLWICFNGGKDCTALLHIFHAVASRKLLKDFDKVKLQGICIKCEDQFPEMEKFVEDTASRYNMKLWSYGGPIRAGLGLCLDEHVEMKGVLMGTRRADPSGKDMEPFKMTDPEWPQVMRVSPLLEWSFGDVWKFIRTLSLPYCTLYDRG